MHALQDTLMDHQPTPSAYPQLVSSLYLGLAGVAR